MAETIINPRLTEQEVVVPLDYTKLIVPFKLLLCGSSGCGKTNFALEILKSPHILSRPFKHCLLCVPPNSTHLLSETIHQFKIVFPSLRCIEGLPQNEDMYIHGFEDILVLIEDMFLQACNSSTICNLMTFGSRRRNISIILTSQNPFQNSKHCITIRRNMSYTVIFSQICDKTVLQSIGRAQNPLRPNDLLNSFNALIKSSPKDKFLYLLIDTHSISPLPDCLKLRSNIFSQEPLFFVTNHY
jgi:hypothetical protein